MKAFTGWMNEAKTTATGFTGAISGIPGIFGAVGVGGIAAGASVAGLAAEMKKLGERALDLKELSRETGMTKDFIAAWDGAGQHFNVAREAMEGMLDTFAGQLPQFQQGDGAMFKEFSRWGATVGKIQEDIAQKNPGKALRDALEQLESVGKEYGPQVQKQVAEAMMPGHGADLEKLMGDRGLAGLRAQLNKSWVVPSDALAKQEMALRDATSAFNNQLTDFENRTGPAFLDLMTDIVKKATDFFTLDRSGINKRQHDGGSADERQDSSHDADYLKQIPRRTLPAAPTDPQPPTLTDPENIRRGADKQTFGLMGKKASYDDAGFGNLRQNASFTTGADPSSSSQFGLRWIMTDATKAGVVAAFREMMIDQGGKDAAGGGAGGGGAGGDDGAPAGGGMGGGFSAGRRGFGAREGHFGGRRGFMKSGADGADYGMPSKSLLDFIAKSEGTKGYDTSLGFGRYLPGHHETDLQGKSLKEILDLGRYMRQQPGNPNSSALGRYQITGETIRDLMGRMHLTGDEKFDAKMQDAMASKLIHDEGPRALQRWASLRGGRMATAQDLLKSGSIASMPSGAGPASDVGMHLRALNEQCVSLAKAAVGANGSVHEWRRGVGALAGTLKPGTPVATFLDGFGRKVDRYANGGTGTPGAHLDHAGVFQSYIRDKAGQIVGMNIAEQYKGSHGVHSHAYFNKGWGESNAANYSAVLGPDGQPLGGSRNPINRRATELAAAPHPAAGRRATGLLDSTRDARESASNHKVTVGVEVNGGQVRSTRVEKNGPLQIEMEHRWVTGRNPLIES